MTSPIERLIDQACGMTPTPHGLALDRAKAYLRSRGYTEQELSREETGYGLACLMADYEMHLNRRGAK